MSDRYYSLLTFIILLNVFSFTACSKKSRKNSFDPISISVIKGKYPDYTSSIQKAIDKSNNGQTIVLPKGNIYVNKTLIIKNKSIKIKGSGKQETILIGSGKVFDVKGIPVYKSKIYTEGKERESKIKVKRKAKFKEGALICFRSTELFEEKDVPYIKEHCNKVKTFSRNNLELKKPLPFSFNLSEIEISVFKNQSFELSDLTIQSKNDLYFCTLDYLSDIKIDQVHFQTRNDGNFGLKALNHPRAGMSALAIYHSTNIEVNQCSFNNIWYGVMTHKGCNQILIQNCLAENSRHLNNIGLGSTDLLVKDCSAYNCQGGFDSHETAISSVFDNCKDYSPVLESKFRGRNDVIKNSYFEGGIQMFYDSHFNTLIHGKAVLQKRIENSKVLNIHSVFRGSNISILNTDFDSSVEIHHSQGKITVEDCSFSIKEKKNKKNKQRPEVLTIGGKGLKSFDYSYSLINCEFECKGENAFPMAIYIPVQGGKKGILKDIIVKGFEKGLVLYGGSEASSRYDNLVLENILFEDCKYGIFHQAVNKRTDINDVKFNNCQIPYNNSKSFLKRKRDNK